MSKVILPVVLLLIAVDAFAQIAPKMSADGKTLYVTPEMSADGKTLYVTPDIKFSVGEEVKIGTGTSEDGDLINEGRRFDYIMMNMRVGLLGPVVPTDVKMGREYIGRLGTIKKITMEGNYKRGYRYNSRHGYHYELLLEFKRKAHVYRYGGKYRCEIVKAITSGEVECNGCEQLRNGSTVVIKNTPDVADESGKQKKVKDDGIYYRRVKK